RGWPRPAFQVSCTVTACEFDASASNDPDGAIVDYAWSWGDGAIGDGEVTSHTYGVGGFYDVELTVTDDAGQVNGFGVRLTVGAVFIDGFESGDTGAWTRTIP
ncbi:MAG: PKD domain-containing protein, partial [Acidobacteriota bacterium]